MVIQGFSLDVRFLAGGILAHYGASYATDGILEQK